MRSQATNYECAQEIPVQTSYHSRYDQGSKLSLYGLQKNKSIRGEQRTAPLPDSAHQYVVVTLANGRWRQDSRGWQLSESVPVLRFNCSQSDTLGSHQRIAHQQHTACLLPSLAWRGTRKECHPKHFPRKMYGLAIRLTSRCAVTCDAGCRTTIVSARARIAMVTCVCTLQRMPQHQLAGASVWQGNFNEQDM